MTVLWRVTSKLMSGYKLVDHCLAPVLINIWRISLICILYSCSRRRQWQPTPVPLPGKSHGQRSLVGYSPWGHKESDNIVTDVSKSVIISFHSIFFILHCFSYFHHSVFHLSYSFYLSVSPLISEIVDDLYYYYSELFLR